MGRCAGVWIVLFLARLANFELCALFPIGFMGDFARPTLGEQS